MANNTSPLTFNDSPQSISAKPFFLLQVPENIQSKPALFSAYSKAGSFPGYFGENWDAFLDCLRDFSWLDQRLIIIAHTDLPFSQNHKELETYIDILETAVTDWKNLEARPYPKSQPPMRFVFHELIVVFPTSCKPTIESTRNG